MAPASLDETCVNALRFLAADAVEQAGSGHPGMPLGAAPMAYVLWDRFLAHNPKNPEWPNRDRFVLSAGHGSALLYALLHLYGYDLPLEELENFRQLHSRTPGHPEYGDTPGVETTTGPLGQGFANGVGMALAERYLSETFNTDEHPVVDHYTYGIVSDGDLMEGVSAEAGALAGHLGLGKLIYLYDQNCISIEGETDLAFTERVASRFEAQGWHVQHVDDGTDLDDIEAAIAAAQDATTRPSIICVHTHIGYGSPQQDTAAVHGSPLGAEDLAVGTHEFRLKQMDLGEGGHEYSAPVTVPLGVPDALTFRDNFPNPFSAQTTIRYELPRSTPVRLIVFDLLGRRVKTLVDAQQTAGRHQVRLSASDLASGTYLVRLSANRTAQTTRVTVAR